RFVPAFPKAYRVPGGDLRIAYLRFGASRQRHDADEFSGNRDRPAQSAGLTELFAGQGGRLCRVQESGNHTRKAQKNGASQARPKRLTSAAKSAEQRHDDLR
ncbi:MAG: hypothetical protein KGO02_16925, partial [Alphaproteobacteria bacterium]|nr:hypothetical protein [Alphaproteobacteria bacterium]